MKITLEAGDRITIPKVCTAIIRGNHILIKKKGWEFENGNILTAISMFSYNCPFIFKGVDDSGFYTFYAGLNCEAELIIGDDFSRFGNGEIVYATQEEKQLLFDKMKEQGLQWNPEEKKIEKIEQ